MHQQNTAAIMNKIFFMHMVLSNAAFLQKLRNEIDLKVIKKAVRDAKKD